jgi:hypothetical protein
VRSTTEMFDRLDGRHGGGHARRALIEFLRTDLAALLRGSFSGDVGCELFKVASQSTLLGAWMSYDAGLHGLAQRNFVQALKLAEEAGDRLLAAGVLDAMSHQANFLGNHREAANLARAARMGTASVGSAYSAAHFYAIEARALWPATPPAATKLWPEQSRSSNGASRKTTLRTGLPTSTTPNSQPSWATATAISAGPSTRVSTRPKRLARTVSTCGAISSSPWFWPMRTWARAKLSKPARPL